MKCRCNKASALRSIQIALWLYSKKNLFFSLVNPDLRGLILLNPFLDIFQYGTWYTFQFDKRIVILAVIYLNNVSSLKCGILLVLSTKEQPMLLHCGVRYRLSFYRYCPYVSIVFLPSAIYNVKSLTLEYFRSINASTHSTIFCPFYIRFFCIQ